VIIRDSLILRATTRLIFPLTLVFSVFLLVRGHNEPGGGFVGGLTAAAGLALVLASDGLDRARQVLRFEPFVFIGAGLTVALLSGVAPLFDGGAFLTGHWLPAKVPVIGHLGTPLVFDVGVYLAVLGVVTAIVFELAEERP
jgi:multicomponent Na+:H+ antiporter subunit B